MTCSMKSIHYTVGSCITPTIDKVVTHSFYQSFVIQGKL